MEERDAFPRRPVPRRLINDLDAGRAAPIEYGVEIVDGKADVMDARPACREELSDRGFGFVRLQQFDQGFTGREAADARPIGVMQRYRGKAEDVAVEGEDAFHVLDGDPDVGDVGGHPIGGSERKDSQETP